MELHRSFLQLGLESRLVTTRANHSEAAMEAGITAFERRNPARAYYAPDLRRQAERLVAAADVVHGHGFYVATNWILGRQARKSGKPLVYHPHGFFEPWILQRSRLKKQVASWLFEGANFRAARLWRALTGKEADQIRSLGIVAPIVIAPNGIRMEVFDRVEQAAPKQRRRLLFLGRLHPKKGLPLLLHAWASAGTATRDWEAVIAGPDEGGHLAEVQALASRLGIADAFSFPGVVTGEAKVSLLKSADLFALTSHSEGFSIAILEALACQVPVLATDACNFSELAAIGAGWECTVEPSSVAAALRTALGATDLERRQRGEIGRRLVASRYNWNAIAKTIIDATEQHCF
jgi:glycosyltransferase involved in cell wall biosynthesis